MKDVEPRPPLGGALERGRETVSDQTGGDAVCWLDRVCDACGRLTERDDSVCPRCGQALA